VAQKKEDTVKNHHEARGSADNIYHM